MNIINQLNQEISTKVTMKNKNNNQINNKQELVFATFLRGPCVENACLDIEVCNCRGCKENNCENCEYKCPCEI